MNLDVDLLAFLGHAAIGGVTFWVWLRSAWLKARVDGLAWRIFQIEEAERPAAPTAIVTAGGDHPVNLADRLATIEAWIAERDAARRKYEAGEPFHSTRREDRACRGERR